MDDDQRWQLPDSYLPHVTWWPGADRWLPTLSRIAAQRAKEWGLVPDGAVMHGWTGVVWPVRTNTGQRAVLKVSPPVDWTASEIPALQAFSSGSADTSVAMVRPLAADPDDRAVLLPRLTADRSLEEHPDIDAAVATLAELLAGIRDVPAVVGIPDLADHLEELAPHLRAGNGVDDAAADRARGRLRELRELAADPIRQRLLHGDAHFLNVLHTLPDEAPAWVGIDPAPLNGIIEWEPVPLLRNRWADAIASGAPDRALRRRVDQICEATGGDPQVVVACAQVQAVAAIAGWQMAADHLHHPPYLLMTRW